MFVHVLNRLREWVRFDDLGVCLVMVQPLFGFSCLPVVAGIGRDLSKHRADGLCLENHLPMTLLG